MSDDVTPEGGRPEWANSVTAFASASRKSVTATTATQLQFPSTNQLEGICGSTFSGSAFTNGLINYGDPNTQGVAGAVVGGTQYTADSLCGMMGGAGVDTTPQAIITGATDVQTTVDSSPMASGTIELGQDPEPAGNIALDAINGVQNLSNTLYSIMQGCGCGAQNDPANVGPQQIIDTTQETADGVTGSPFASGIIAMGQEPTGSGNVALDAINGSQFFAGTLFNTLLGCTGCGISIGSAGGQLLDADGQFVADYGELPLDGQLLAETVDGDLPPGGGRLFGVTDPNPYSPYNVSAQTILDVAEDTANVFAANPFGQDIVGARSGNLAIDGLYYGQGLIDRTRSVISNAVSTGNTANDVVTAGGQAINQNTANHQSHVALTTAQSVNLINQNLLVSQDFSTSSTVMPDPDERWEWDGTDGATTLGCLVFHADGIDDDYVSSEVAVVAGETIEIACQYKTVAPAYIGIGLEVPFEVPSPLPLQDPSPPPPISVGVQKYRKAKSASGAITYLDIGHYDAITVDTPTEDEWTDVAGTYVVEPGVDQVRLRFRVSRQIVSGTVKFDEGNLLKTDLIADECVPGVGQTVDSIVTQLYGASGAGFTQNEAAVALGNTASSLASVNMRLAALEAEGFSGPVAGDDFSWTGEITANANWDGDYSASASYGYYSADGAIAAWHPMTFVIVPVLSQTAYFDWVGSDDVSTTNYQHVEMVLASAPTRTSSISLVGRLASGWGSYVYATITSAGNYSVGYMPGNHVLASGTMTVPGAGARIALALGDPVAVAPRHFKLTVNSTTICDFDEVGTGSPLGASNRKWGWGAYAYSWTEWVTEYQGHPPSINQWLAYDTGV